jgi:phage head maturation protease
MYQDKIDNVVANKHTNRAFYCIGIADPGTGTPGGFFFTKEQLHDIIQQKSLIKTKVWLEHGDKTTKTIGEVVYAWVDDEAGLMVVIKLFNNILMSKVVVEWIKSGICSGISLGYDATVMEIEGNMHVTSKKINEISIVSTPFHKTCKIYRDSFHKKKKTSKTNGFT